MPSILRAVCLSAFLGSLCAASLAVAAPPKSDQELLQGEWVCTATLRDGNKVETYVGVKAMIDGDNLTWYFPQKDGAYREQKNKFRINAGSRHFDWWRPENAQSVDWRLYTVTENEMRMATNLDYKTRPDSFDKARWQFTCKRVARAR